ncbi:cytochrome P450 [Pararhizobium sp. IMCC21322]|uniref:cytochrome P450 n=1 Tax=Pararhizobium sp. IMCC21322 TaxID=3067903 RepID=UPI00274269D6|nr:cytochrome P450 [Pararhizobium sp. IMCC21322]
MKDIELTGREVPTDTATTLAMLESDPASVYRRLRRESPIVRLEALGRIVFSKADDTHRIKSDTEHFGCYDTTTPMQRAFRGHTLMRKDGPEHLRERRAMAGAFTADTITSHWRPEIESIVDELLDGLPQSGSVDLFTAFASPLAAHYVKLVLGLESATEAQLLDWAPTLIQGAMNAQFNADVFARCDTANDDMDACFNEMAHRYRQTPNKSALSEMVNGDEPLPFSQIGTNMRVCIAGSLVESRDGFLSTLIGILGDPKQKQFCVETNAWRAACEEGLRWIAPIQANARVVLKSTVIRGFCIPKGETVMVLQASANHDEDIWEKPDQFDARRTIKPNQTFGNGPHKCLGSDLYKMLIADVVLPKLFERFPQISLEKPTDITFHGFAFRGPKSCSVQLG